MSGEDTNLYDTLGIGPDATEEDIKKSAKKMMKSIRESDARNSEKNELLRFLKNTRNTLVDPQSREAYDRTIGIQTIYGSGRCVEPDRQIVDSVVPFSLGEPAVDPMNSMDSISSALTSFGSPFGVSGSSRSSIESMMGIESIGSMLSSIIPQELQGSVSGTPKSGTFQFMEYTKVRNSSGGYDEFGTSREGDLNNDHVTERRFNRKS